MAPQTIIDYCRANMASQKAPRRVFYYQPGDLPLTPAGKLKKKELTARTAQMVEADSGAGLVGQKETQQ